MTKPIGELTLRTLAMPADANAAGDIFGGWVMAQMDLSCGIRAAERARGRVVTAAVKEMAFAKPVKIGDTLCVYTHIAHVGRTSIRLEGRGMGTALSVGSDGAGYPCRLCHGCARQGRQTDTRAGGLMVSSGCRSNIYPRTLLLLQSARQCRPTGQRDHGNQSGAGRKARQSADTRSQGL